MKGRRLQTSVEAIEIPTFVRIPIWNIPALTHSCRDPHILRSGAYASWTSLLNVMVAWNLLFQFPEWLYQANDARREAR